MTKAQQILIAFSACLTCTISLAFPEIKVTSPDASIRMTIQCATNRIQYTVSATIVARHDPVIEPSALRFVLDGDDITAGVEVGVVKRYKVNQTYPWRGIHSTATNHCNGAVIGLKGGKSHTTYSLEIRVYNDGAAFRYIIPGENVVRVPDESDTFTLPSGSIVWYHNENGHYEGVHQAKYLGEVQAEVQAGDWAMPPVTFNTPGCAYGAITEAALENFSGMALRADGSNQFSLALAHKQPASYPFRLRYSNDVERLSHPAAITRTITSPWRVIMLGRDLNALVNCDIVHNLCAPPDPRLFPRGIHEPWLKPGRAVWKYLDGGESTLEGTKEFCRLAGELGFEYNVVEGYWSRWSDEEIKDLVGYARQQGVGLWFWKHSRALRTPQAREEFFSKLEALGVVGAKIDFFDHEHKELIDLYQALLADAAKHKILINFHGSNKPTGEERTWPNELTREAIRGMEASKLADRATHDTTLPFTRYLAGHGDYTVMHFGARRTNTTWAHQIATAALFNQPLNTIVANPATILTNPAVAMIKTIPPVWDETIVLEPSEIGELALYARRSGNKWFLVAVNGLNPRSIRVPLSFLPRGAYRAWLVCDDENSSATLHVEERSVKRGESLTIKLTSGGGFVARFERAAKKRE